MLSSNVAANLAIAYGLLDLPTPVDLSLALAAEGVTPAQVAQAVTIVQRGGVADEWTDAVIEAAGYDPDNLTEAAYLAAGTILGGLFEAVLDH